jgi:hypothetical protein
MANVPNPRDFERAVNIRIQETVDELVERLGDEAFGEWGGRRVRFEFRWHEIDPMTTIEAPITGVHLEEDGEGDYRLMFQVHARDPRNGQIFPITRSRHTVEFI